MKAIYNFRAICGYIIPVLTKSFTPFSLKLTTDHWPVCSPLQPVAELYSKILDAHPLGPIFFIFMQFLTHFGQIIIGWHLGLAPPPLGIPGSAADKSHE